MDRVRLGRLGRIVDVLWTVRFCEGFRMTYSAAGVRKPPKEETALARSATEGLLWPADATHFQQKKSKILILLP
jgi:hypothetical protein